MSQVEEEEKKNSQEEDSEWNSSDEDSEEQLELKAFEYRGHGICPAFEEKNSCDGQIISTQESNVTIEYPKGLDERVESYDNAVCRILTELKPGV